MIAMTCLRLQGTTSNVSSVHLCRHEAAKIDPRPPQSYCFEHCRGSVNGLGRVWRIEECTRLGDRPYGCTK